MKVTAGDGGAFALVFWIVMFWGDPDIADAIIYYLMGVQ